MALSADRVRANLAEVHGEILEAAQRAGRRFEDVDLVAAVKYVEAEDLGALAEAGITVFGENRAQELVAKAQAQPGVTWDFIGQLQSRKVKTVAPLVRCIHSVGSLSAIAQLGKVEEPPDLLMQVNIAREAGKAGIEPQEAERFCDAATDANIVFDGLMVMPPQADRPEDSRRWFAAARELAADLDLAVLSMGTTQDFVVAVEEGATMVRIGSRLYR